MTTPTPPIKVGDTIWAFDENHRVYAEGTGHTSGPIWREHWRPMVIKGETRVSWIIETVWHGSANLTKVPKKSPDSRWFLFSERDVDRAVWIHEQKYALSRLVLAVADYSTMATIAKLLGVVPPKDL